MKFLALQSVRRKLRFLRLFGGFGEWAGRGLDGAGEAQKAQKRGVWGAESAVFRGGGEPVFKVLVQFRGRGEGSIF